MAVQQAPELPAGPLHLVICEDCDDIADLLSDVLRDLGHEVTVAKTGSDAIDTILRVKPHAALLDIGLPDMNGYDVARAVRAGLGTKTRLVAVTGYGQERDHSLAREAGFDALVVKPATLTTIMNAMYFPIWKP